MVPRDKEIVVPFDKLGNSQEITRNNARIFKEHGLDIHRNEVTDITDDHDTKVRRYKIKKVKYFGPWTKRG